MNLTTNEICNILSFLNKYKHRNLYYVRWCKNYDGTLSTFQLYLIRSIKPMQNRDAFALNASEIIKYLHQDCWYEHHINNIAELIIDDRQLYSSFKSVFKFKSFYIAHNFICDEKKLHSLLHSSIIMKNISGYKFTFKNTILNIIKYLPNIPCTWTIN